MKLVAGIKNIKDNVNTKIENALNSVKLEKIHWDKLGKQLSGGMKRKLSLAMSILADP